MDTTVPVRLIRVARFKRQWAPVRVVKTLRFQLPVLDASDVGSVLDLVTRVDGVIAALVDAHSAEVDVVVASAASAILVKNEIVNALAAA